MTIMTAVFSWILGKVSCTCALISRLPGDRMICSRFFDLGKNLHKLYGSFLLVEILCQSSTFFLVLNNNSVWTRALYPWVTWDPLSLVIFWSPTIDDVIFHLCYGAKISSGYMYAQHSRTKLKAVPPWDGFVFPATEKKHKQLIRGTLILAPYFCKQS